MIGFKLFLMEAMMECGKFDEMNILQKGWIRNQIDFKNVSSIVKKEKLERIGKIHE
jgi:hypothetical protein